MAKIFRYLLILINLHQIYSDSVAETEDLQKKFTSKCDDLCINQNENETTKVILRWCCCRILTVCPHTFLLSVHLTIYAIFIHVYSFVFPTKDFGKSECLRGCQYFNIEFLLNARNKDKTVDLNQLVERCGSCKCDILPNLLFHFRCFHSHASSSSSSFFSSLFIACSEAYKINKSFKECCFRGCNEMAAIQAGAPAVNGWLVYMGATDRNMVLLQPDFDIPSKEDWVLLDSIFRANDYDYDSQYTNYDKILKADSRGQIDSVSRVGNRDRFTINYCIPSWMWILPLLMLVAFIWMHYSNYIYSAFIHERLQHDFDIVDANHFNAIPMNHQTAMNAGNKKALRPSDEYIVGSDYFFYPAPAVPPPKYNDVAESILIGSSDDEDDGGTNNTNELRKKNATRSTGSMPRTKSQNPSTSII